jgi:hypothetical protein
MLTTMELSEKSAIYEYLHCAGLLEHRKNFKHYLLFIYHCALAAPQIFTIGIYFTVN